MELELIEQSDEMKFQEWFDKHDGDLLCMECEDIARQAFMAGMKSRPTPRAADGLVRCQKCNALIETTVHCDNCGTFEPTRR